MHGTAVARQGRGVLLIGASGAGKSALGLQLMALGADLVADDAVELRQQGERISLHCPDSICGMIEARQVGLISVKAIDHAGLEFVVDLDKTAGKRLPEPDSLSILGTDVPLIKGKDVPNLAAVIWCLLGDGRLKPIR